MAKKTLWKFLLTVTVIVAASWAVGYLLAWLIWG